MTYPQYAPPAQPAYAPPAPPQQGQAIAPPVPQLRDGGSTGGSAQPKMRHLIGRTIVVIPKRVDENAMDTTSNPPKSRPEAYFDLIVVDGGPLRYGDSQDRDVSKQRPNTHEIDTPCIFRNANDYGFGFVQAVRDALSAGEAGRAGVVQQGTKGNKPYLITKCGTDVHGETRPDGDARFAAAMDVFGKVWNAQHGGPPFPNPEPRSLVVAPPAGYAPQVAYGQPPAQPSYPAQVAPNGYYMPPQSAPPAAPATPAQPAPGSYEAWVASQQSAPPVASLPPQVEAWLASLPADQQAGARAQYLASAPTQGQPAGPGI